MAPTMYSQRYDGWRHIMLGESSTTIGQYGCLVCSAASGLTDVGVTIDGLPPDPPRLNRWLTRNEGFSAPSNDPEERNLFVFGALGPLGVRLVEYVDCHDIPAPVAKIRDALRRDDQFVVLQVDFRPGDGESQQHWVRALAWFDADIQLMDPWIEGADQTAYLMTRYALPGWDGPARAVFRIVVYRYDRAGVPFGLPEGVAPIVQEQPCPYPYAD